MASVIYLFVVHWEVFITLFWFNEICCWNFSVLSIIPLKVVWIRMQMCLLDKMSLEFSQSQIKGVVMQTFNQSNLITPHSLTFLTTQKQKTFALKISFKKLIHLHSLYLPQHLIMRKLCFDLNSIDVKLLNICNKKIEERN